MKTIETDILVVGGGSAGIAAAIAASNCGYKVTVVERNTYLGGKATSAEVGTICGLYKFSKSENSEYAVHGFAKTFSQKLSALSGTQALHNNQGLHYLPYNIEVYKKFCLDLMQQYQIELHLNTEITKVILSNELIESVNVKSENSYFKIDCKSIIDCSGDSVVSQLASLPLITNDNYQAAAQIFTMQGMAEVKEETLGILLMKELHKAIQNNILENYFDRVYVVQGSIKNNMASFKVGIPIPVTYTQNNIEDLRTAANEMINRLVDFFTQHISVFKNASLHSIAPEVGLRVGIRPVGKYILTEEDVLQCKKFDSAIANGAWPIEEWGQDKRVKMKYFKYEDFYQIPADCLVSNTINNLFFAGRNISATDGAIASARVMGICFQTGYAAGKLAISQINNTSKSITIKAIQEEQIFA